MYASDVDLLRMEPNLFRDYVWTGQRLSAGDGEISEGHLIGGTFGPGFDSAGVTTGYVVTVNDVGFEVMTREGFKDLAISRARGSSAELAILPEDAESVSFQISTFRPQIGIVHGQIMRMAGIEPGSTGAGATEDAIVNRAALARVEALGALHLIFAAAGAPGGRESAAAQHAERYRRLFEEERRRTRVELDLDGDGKPDVTRALTMAWLVRGV